MLVISSYHNLFIGIIVRVSFLQFELVPLLSRQRLFSDSATRIDPRRTDGFEICFVVHRRGQFGCLRGLTHKQPVVISFVCFVFLRLVSCLRWDRGRMDGRLRRNT